jgi:hypothetical protein
MNFYHKRSLIQSCLQVFQFAFREAKLNIRVARFYNYLPLTIGEIDYLLIKFQIQNTGPERFEIGHTKGVKQVFKLQANSFTACTSRQLNIYSIKQGYRFALTHCYRGIIELASHIEIAGYPVLLFERLQAW